MKKIYVKPGVKVVKLIHASKIMAGSLTGDYVKSGNADASENLGRSNDFGDDEY